MDFFYTDQFPAFQMNKHMLFPAEGKPVTNDMMPDEIMEKTFENGWRKCKSTLFKVDRESINNLKRFLLLHEPCREYFTKMDLVDHFPDIWKDCIQLDDGTSKVNP
jgi:hypothetical protein